MKSLIIRSLLLLQVFSVSAVDMTRVKPDNLLSLLDKAIAENKPREAVAAMSHFLIRTRLDAACCNDSSVVAVRDALTIRQWTNPKLTEVLNQLSDQERKEIFEQQVNAYEQALKNKQFPSPEWIAQYGMNVFIGSDDKLFIRTSECHKKQTAMIAEYKKELSNAKQNKQ